METESSVLPTTNTITIDAENHEYQLEYAYHDHPLTLCEIDDTYCTICRETCLGGRTYGCKQCGLFLHESCTKIQIPQVIDHYFHHHPLRLAMKQSKHLDSRCIACDDSLPGLMFECSVICKFYMDVECALLPTKLKQDGCIDHIQLIQHPHPLILCDDEKIYENKLCTGCQDRLSTRPRFSYGDTLLLPEGSESIYGCLRCGFFLHERCSRLPREIDSPFHPGHHILDLIWSDYDPIPTCQGCCRPHVNRYTYQCLEPFGSCNFTVNECNFILGLECAFLRAPILKLETQHFLTLYPSVNPLLSCVVCDKKCDSSNIFRCVQHDYTLHLHCGPLPSVIKDKCHVDPLKLMYAFVEDGYVDDTVYCDACEQPRDPDQCVYYCKDCNFVAEIKCVEAEVLRSLNGQRGNVKLRTANKTRNWVRAKLISSVITDNVETDSDNKTVDIGANYLEVEELHENFLLACYTDEECEQLIEIFKKARVQLRPSTSFLQDSFWIHQESCKALCAHIERYELVLAELQSKGKQEFKTSIFCYSLDEESDNGENAITGLLSSDFKQLMRNLDSYYEQDELLEVFFRRDCKVVRIGEHKIIQDSASLLKGLLLKYGDFTTRTKLSERLKAIFLTMFCEVIRSMCLTNVREVENGVLHKWWKALKLVQLAGFEIEFAIDQLYKVVHASFGMKAITSCHEMKSWVDKTSDEIEEEEAKLEARKRELEAKKREFEELKYGIEYESSPILKECLEHVSELKWKKAWDGSPIMFR